MTKTNLNGIDQSANSEDFESVAVCFRDPSINALFADLLQVRGIKAKTFTEIYDVEQATKIITEPIFLPDLTPSQMKKCLVVGNKDLLNDLESVTLARPLTEEKINAAISAFLKI